MTVLNTILTIVFIILSIVITVIILMQEGKSAGLGAIAGAADTYWGKNKGRSMEGMLVKLTRIFVILFLVIAMVLHLGIWSKPEAVDYSGSFFHYTRRRSGYGRKV